MTISLTTERAVLQLLYETPYQLPKGSWVFPPTKMGRDRGAEIVGIVRDRWTPPPIYYHFANGGHVAAIAAHLENEIFAAIDLTSFFHSNRRSRVHRALKKIGIPSRESYDIASDSTVNILRIASRAIPYGFVQAPLLATLCMDFSHLGVALRNIDDTRITITVYVDDIILSSKSANKEYLDQTLKDLVAAIDKSNYSLNPDKTQRPSNSVKVFNILVSNNHSEIIEPRLTAFKQAIKESDDEISINGISNYIGSINSIQQAEIQNFIDSL